MFLNFIIFLGAATGRMQSIAAAGSQGSSSSICQKDRREATSQAKQCDWPTVVRHTVLKFTLQFVLCDNKNDNNKILTRSPLDTL